MKLHKHVVREGTLFALRDGEVVHRARFTPHPYEEDDPLPAVRTPREAEACLSALAALAALAAA